MGNISVSNKFRLAAVEKTRSKGPYDLIILDLDMPIMDGFEACRLIRADNCGQGIKDLLHIEKHEYLGNDDEEEYKNFEEHKEDMIEIEDAQESKKLIIIAITAFLDD